MRRYLVRFIHKMVEPLCFLGDFGAEDGVERSVSKALVYDGFAVAPLQPLIFLEREHHDARRAVPRDPDRTLHRLVGVETEAIGDILGGDGEEGF